MAVADSTRLVGQGEAEASAWGGKEGAPERCGVARLEAGEARRGEAKRGVRKGGGGGAAAAAAATGDSGEVGEREQDSKGKGSAAQII